MMVKKARLKLIPVSLILILSLLLSSGCFYIETPAPPATTPPPEIPAQAPANPDWTLPPLSEYPPLPDFVSVVAQVKPSVVAINTEVVTLDIFNRPFTQEGAGSGWIIDSDGHIVTNNHVVDDARNITVTLSDGRTLAATIVGTDTLADLAVVRVEATDLPSVSIGDSSDLNIGEWVLAIGNALGLGITAKEGIVSRLGVSVPVSAGQTLHDLIETSAAINPGNSGGPLVNMSGEVIGITSAKLTGTAVEGLGYAISTRTARPIIEELIQRGYVLRPWLGVGLATVNQFLILRYDLSIDKGAFITEVVPGSPADLAGLEVGDVVMGLGTEKISTSDELVRAIHASEIGEEVEIILWRGGAELTLAAKLSERPKT